MEAHNNDNGRARGNQSNNREKTIGGGEKYFSLPPQIMTRREHASTVRKRERDGRRAECTQNSHTRDTQMEQGTNLQKEFW